MFWIARNEKVQQDEEDMNSQEIVAVGRKAALRRKAGTIRKRRPGAGIKARKVVAALFLLSFFVFTLGVVCYVIFLGGVQA